MSFVLVPFVDDDSNLQAAIFARDEERAEVVWDHIRGRLEYWPEDCSTSEWDAFRLFGLVRHQWEAEERCEEGIGTYAPEAGWTILPLDYEDFDLDRPSNGEAEEQDDW